MTGKKVGQKTVGRYLCKCDCGKVLPVFSNSLKQGWSKSCGCLRLELGVGVKTHGETFCPEYRSWACMKARCYTKSATDYNNYGGRGIKVCMRWKNYVNFVSDLGRKPTAKHSIERINNNRHYSCGKCSECRNRNWKMNCRWATQRDQTRNTRRTRLFRYNGESMVLADWSKETGISRLTLSSRLLRFGWSTKRAFTTPPRPSYPRNRLSQK